MNTNVHKSGKPRRSDIPVAMGLLVGMLFVFAASVSLARDAKYLRYEEFIAAVESGQVKEVRLDEYSKIAGVFRDGDTEEQFETYAGGVGTANDPLLLRLMVRHRVRVTLAPPREHGFWYATGVGGLFTGLVMIALPVLTFFYVAATHRRVKTMAKRDGNSGKS